VRFRFCSGNLCGAIESKNTSVLVHEPSVHEHVHGADGKIWDGRCWVGVDA
jgi:hypothetical protein